MFGPINLSDYVWPTFVKFYPRILDASQSESELF